MESVVCRPPRIRSSGAPARPPPPPVHSRRGCARPADEWKRTEPSGSGARARKDARQDSGFKFGPLAGQSGPLWPARRPASQPATGPANSGRANDSRSSQASNNLMVPRPSLALIVARKADLARLQRQWQWQWRRRRRRQRIGRLAGGRRAHLAPARRPPATQIKARAKPSWAPIWHLIGALGAQNKQDDRRSGQSHANCASTGRPIWAPAGRSIAGRAQRPVLGRRLGGRADGALCWLGLARTGDNKAPDTLTNFQAVEPPPPPPGHINNIWPPNQFIEGPLVAAEGANDGYGERRFGRPARWLAALGASLAPLGPPISRPAGRPLQRTGRGGRLAPFTWPTCPPRRARLARRWDGQTAAIATAAAAAATTPNAFDITCFHWDRLFCSGGKLAPDELSAQKARQAARLAHWRPGWDRSERANLCTTSTYLYACWSVYQTLTLRPRSGRPGGGRKKVEGEG